MNNFFTEFLFSNKHQWESAIKYIYVPSLFEHPSHLPHPTSLDYSQRPCLTSPESHYKFRWLSILHIVSFQITLSYISPSPSCVSLWRMSSFIFKNIFLFWRSDNIYLYIFWIQSYWRFIFIFVIHDVKKVKILTFSPSTYLMRWLTRWGHFVFQGTCSLISTSFWPSWLFYE